jgi:hypothetical protein
VLEEASYSVWFQDWDFRGNFVEHMNRAHAQADRTLAVLSDHYFGSDFTLAEWSARFAQDPAAREDRLVPLKVGSLTGENILGPIIYADLTDCDEDYARQRLLGRVKSEACDWQGTVRMHVIWWNACGHCLDWPIRQCRTVRRNTHQSGERRRVPNRSRKLETSLCRVATAIRFGNTNRASNWRDSVLQNRRASTGEGKALLDELGP